MLSCRVANTHSTHPHKKDNKLVITFPAVKKKTLRLHRVLPPYTPATRTPHRWLEGNVLRGTRHIPPLPRTGSVVGRHSPAPSVGGAPVGFSAAPGTPSTVGSPQLFVPSITAAGPFIDSQLAINTSVTVLAARKTTLVSNWPAISCLRYAAFYAAIHH